VQVEEFKQMPVNWSNAVLGIMDVSKGSISCTVTDVMILLQAASKANASGISECYKYPFVIHYIEGSANNP
jgi:hypothetical protein